MGKSVDPATLEHVERELNNDDFEYYDRVGWKHYRPEYHIDTLLPTFGEPICFKYRNNIVIKIGQQNYKFDLIERDYDKPWSPDGKTLVLTPTDDEPTKPDFVGEPDWRASYYYKFFGQPRWIQGPHHVADMDGVPLRHLVTIENGWGDSGNYNILIGLDENGVPNLAYFEASCC
jgi:hypothetical protein